MITLMMLALSIFVAVPPEAASWRCSGPAPYGRGQTVGIMLDSAEVVVHARVVGDFDGFEPLDSVFARMGMRRIRFEVLAVLKGEEPSAPIWVHGMLVAKHRINTGAVPYAFPRHGGGSCFPVEYRLGGEYLLVMRQQPGLGLTPNWASMALVAEAVSGPNDPWLRYVEAYYAAQP